MTAAEHARPPWALLLSLYTTQYLAPGFFMVALVAILRRAGMPLEQLGAIYLLGLFWVLKFLWAPWVDRLSFGRWGHERGWLLLAQAGMVLALLAMAPLDPVQDFSRVLAGCVVVGALSATQDLAADALACRRLAPSDRALGNAIQAAGGLLGNLLGAGAVLVLYERIGWAGAMALLAAGTAVSWVQLLALREPPQPRVPPERAGLRASVVGLWRRPQGARWLAMLALYPVGVSMAYALLTPLLADAGWSLEGIGWVVNGLGSLLGIVSALATGWLIRRGGRRRALVVAAALQVPGVLALLPLVGGDSGTGAALAGAGLLFLFYNPALVVMSTLMMDRVDPARPATDYALQYGLFLGFATVVTGGATALAGVLGYGTVLALAVLAALAAVPLALTTNAGLAGPQEPAARAATR
ncbi:MFS transporter [Rubrivivax gelatinosus]|uniref:Putative MFS family arabinose efflux permease n=1 Tax=Rubrivivax gelatinosus TaxID=28068 RepID=A0A4R2MEZ0_RUBGE|nr:MFS transporter [Rubrivivax gelatinosus]MBK1688926.1 MFS transporter [Rubrivivax gelatinosus]TCP05422.1 putative MFS family arabinose efflux permease [Rubrivivax gelatinosus]